MNLSQQMKELADRKLTVESSAEDFYRGEVLPEIKRLAILGHHECVINPWYYLGDAEGDFLVELSRKDGFNVKQFFNLGGVKQLKIRW